MTADVLPHIIFGVRMKQARERHGWSQRELGRRSGITSVALGKIEAGGGITLDHAVTIAATLRAPLLSMLILWTCGQCLDSPPAGYTCQACSAHGGAVSRG